MITVLVIPIFHHDGCLYGITTLIRHMRPLGKFNALPRNINNSRPLISPKNVCCHIYQHLPRTNTIRM